MLYARRAWSRSKGIIFPGTPVKLRDYGEALLRERCWRISPVKQSSKRRQLACNYERGGFYSRALVIAHTDRRILPSSSFMELDYLKKKMAWTVWELWRCGNVHEDVCWEYTFFFILNLGEVIWVSIFTRTLDKILRLPF